MNNVISNENLDKKQTEDTFRFYESMIAPIRQIERKATRCGEVERELNRVREMKIHIVLVLVILIVLSNVSLAVGAIAVTAVMGDEMNGTAAIAGIVAATVCFVLGCVLVYTIFKRYKNSKINEQESLYRELSEDCQRDINSESQNLSRIPRQYWSSSALEFFVREYRSGKVDTVKEAMQAYDTHCHRMNVENSQQRIIRQNEQIMRNQSELKTDADIILISTFFR